MKLRETEEFGTCDFRSQIKVVARYIEENKIQHEAIWIEGIFGKGTKRERRKNLIALVFQNNRTPTSNVLHFIGGVTGHEGFYVREDLGSYIKDWCVCAGGGGWESLIVGKEEMRKVYEMLKSFCANH